MSKIFNTPFEVSLRIMLLLSVSDGASMTLDRIASYDLMTIYSREFGLSGSVLHGDNEFGLSEFASRRSKTKAALRELVLDGIVKAVATEKGFCYHITPAGKTVADKMTTQYAAEYRRLATITVAKYESVPDEDIVVAINSTSEESIRR